MKNDRKKTSGSYSASISRVLLHELFASESQHSLLCHHKTTWVNLEILSLPAAALVRWWFLLSQNRWGYWDGPLPASLVDRPQPNNSLWCFGSFPELPWNPISPKAYMPHLKPVPTSSISGWDGGVDNNLSWSQRSSWFYCATEPLQRECVSYHSTMFIKNSPFIFLIKPCLALNQNFI